MLSTAGTRSRPGIVQHSHRFAEKTVATYANADSRARPDTRRAARNARHWSRMAWAAVLACMGAAVLVLATPSAAMAESKRVLVLHSFGRDFRPWSEYAKAIRA